MHTLNRHVFFLAFCLSALAGCVDAIGFLELGGHFVSFMSGNSTRLSVSLAGGDHQAALVLASIIGSFVSGAALGVLIRHFTHSPPVSISVLFAVTLLLAAGATAFLMDERLIAVMLIALAMGAENAVFQRDGEVVIGLTYMTGTLVKIGQKIAAAFLGQKRTLWLPYLLLWCGLVTGGILGAVLYMHFGFMGMWVPVAWGSALTIACLLLRRRLVF